MNSYAVISYANGLFGVVRNVTDNVGPILENNPGSVIIYRGSHAACVTRFNQESDNARRRLDPEEAS